MAPDRALDPGIRPAWPGARVVGPAFTVRCHVGDNLAIHRAVERADKGHVLVIDVGRHLAGYWGEILTVAAEVRGIAGVVIDGGLRDTEAMQRHGFGAFARGTALYRTAKNEAGELGVPVVVGGVEIAPGDFVVGDSDGVVAIAAADVSEVVAAARGHAQREASALERIRAGETTLDALGLRR